jgi:CubicO group peptidase (beta-lactamase class C family)
MKKFTQTIELLHGLVERDRVPGVSYTIFTPDFYQREVFGEAMVEPTHQPLWNDALYDVASLTKVVGTTTVILMLVQSGQLRLNDPIQKYLPTFQDARVTVLHLLTHTSGITGYIKNRNELPPDELTQALLNLQVGDDFNRHVKYADIGFIYLGWIIETFYQQPVQTVITNEILKPLGLRKTTFAPDPQQCVPTEIQAKRGLIRGVVHDPKAYILGEHCGCAGLFSDLSDLEQFSRSFLTSNLGGLLSDDTMKTLFADHTPMPGFHGRSLGWRVLQTGASDDHLAVYHTGYTGTWLILDEVRQAGFIMLSNRVHPTVNETFIERRSQIVQTFLHELNQAN